MHLSNTLRVIPINVMCIASLGFVYTARVQINEKLICTIPLNLLRAGMGDGCGAEAESADEPGSRDGILEITSRKGGKLQRPVKPEKQGADVSRKTGSHDGPERGWPREPRGSLEGPRCLFVLSRDGPPGVFKGTSFAGPRAHVFHPFVVSVG